jgi:dihydroorotate dehydrogenase
MPALAALDHRIRPLLSRVLPPSLFVKLYSGGRSWYVKRLSKARADVDGAFHQVTVCDLTFRNDLGNAAGLDKDGTLLEFQHSIGAGFAVVGTVLDAPHTGNLMRAFGKDCNPWTPLPASGAAINSLGLPSKGVQTALDNIKRFQDTVQPTNFPIGLSVMGHPAKSGQEKLDGVSMCIDKAAAVVDFIELNESCPNVGGHDADAAAERIKAAVAARDGASRRVPLFVKMANYGDAAETVRLMTALGVDGLVGVNTQKNHDELRAALPSADHKVFDYYTKTHSGGVSGPVIAEFANSQTAAAAAAIKEQGSGLVLVQVGGIMTPADVKASRQSAPLREWYTGFMEALATRKMDDIYKTMTG